jgi:hypothetical protein
MQIKVLVNIIAEIIAWIAVATVLIEIAPLLIEIAPLEGSGGVAIAAAVQRGGMAA